MIINIFYILSIICLLVSFIFYKKTNKHISIIEDIIYSIGFLFCYNTVIVYLCGLLNLGGSLLFYSIINFCISMLLFLIIKISKKIQKHTFDKKELIISLVLIMIIFLIGYIRFRGFSAISYESGDSSIHYLHAKSFSENLKQLTIENSSDFVYGDFNRTMSISYVNGGFILNLFSKFESYKVFFCYDVFCLILSSLLFLVTVFKLNSKKTKKYIFSLIITLLYTLAFPLNSFLFGFCYLGLSIMVINLLFLTITNFKDEFKNNIIFKLIILFIISFSVFFSYYLFVPNIYLALGIYYIYLYKQKKITIKQLFIYGIITLIIPFIIGFLKFMLYGFIHSDDVNMFVAVSNKGYSYDNVTPIYLFFIISSYLIYDKWKYKTKTTYFSLNLYIITGYILLFLILHVFKYAETYYFYKLFYVYWFYIFILLINKSVKYKKVIYLLFFIICIGGTITFCNNKLTSFLTKLNIYNHNIDLFTEDKIIFNKDEIVLMKESVKYNNICKKSNRFIITGDVDKNVWYYALTKNIPTVNPINKDGRQLYATPNVIFQNWERYSIYDCIIYYYEDEEINYDKSKYNILYENNAGAIIKKK